MAMKMSVFGNVAVLVTLFVLLQCKVHAYEKDYYDNGDDPEVVFIAGTTTPVWLAHENKNGRMVYTRLDKDIVYKALDYYRGLLMRNERLFRRNVDEDISLKTTTEDISVLSMESREENKEEILYPSVLVTMDYTSGSWPSNEEEQEKFIFKKIIYALTYWDKVDVQLRGIRNPSVRIRIAGIVIGKHGHSFPYRLKSNPGRLWNTLFDGLRHWNATRRSNEDFREGTFNVLAMMTDHWTWKLTTWGWSLPGPNCDNTLPDEFIGSKLNQFSGLIVHDDQKFDGICRTVAEITHIMGRSHCGDSMDKTTFTADDFTDMRRGLQRAWCWKKPNEVHPPGVGINIRAFKDYTNFSWKSESSEGGSGN